WFELVSHNKHNATLLAKIYYHQTERIYLEVKDEPLSFEFLQLRAESVTRSTRIPATHLKDTEGEFGVNVHVKLIRTVREDLITFADEDRKAKVRIADESVLVNVSYLSAWSEFFRHYFATNMHESSDDAIEVFPIEECTADEFRELLEVIYPSCKPISQWNVKSMIELADRFIMPALSLKCVAFLTDRTKHNFTDAELLAIGDVYRLPFIQAVLLECLSTDQLRKNVIEKDEYKSYSEDLKRAIDTR
ncbi:hypothetical protein PENTCL1PPCAC_16068, partial [Pristionchus entomophagus]